MPTTDRMRRLRGTLITVTAVVATVGAGVWSLRHLETPFAGPDCTLSSATAQVELDADQAANAATITALSIKRGLPARAAVIAIATAMQESKLYNLDYGDRDSLGLFQQRPSQGWGTVAQVQDPAYAAGVFYDHLVKVSNWQTKALTVAAQAVQRSGFPDAYAQHEADATVIATALLGGTAEAVACRATTADQAAADEEVVDGLKAELGVTASAAGNGVTATATGSRAWAAAGWAVTHAAGTGITSVTVGARRWSREGGSAGLTWQAATTPAATGTVVIGFGR